VLRTRKPAVLFLFLVIASDIYQSFPDHFHKGRIHRVIGFPALILRDADSIRGDLHFVEFFCISEHSAVSFRSYLFQDIIHGSLEFTVVVGAAFQKIFQNVFCAFFCKRYRTHSLHSFPLRSRISLRILSSSIFILTWFTIILAERGHISSSTFSPFSRRVLPVSTISTITSESPTMGASSMDPFNL